MPVDFAKNAILDFANNVDVLKISGLS